MLKKRRAKKEAEKQHRFVIPRSYKFPGKVGGESFKIRILRVTPTEMKSINSCKQCGHHAGEPADGSWDVDSRTIYLDKKIPRSRQVVMFLHEFDHARRDWEEWVRDSGVAKN